MVHNGRVCKNPLPQFIKIVHEHPANEIARVSSLYILLFSSLSVRHSRKTPKKGLFRASINPLTLRMDILLLRLYTKKIKAISPFTFWSPFSNVWSYPQPRFMVPKGCSTMACLRRYKSWFWFIRSAFRTTASWYSERSMIRPFLAVVQRPKAGHIRQHLAPAL